jgi:hypothetical protein
MTGARYQIAVDGQPRSNRDDKAIAIETAEYLKYKHPHVEVIVYDLAWPGALGRVEMLYYPSMPDSGLHYRPHGDPASRSVRKPLTACKLIATLIT